MKRLAFLDGLRGWGAVFVVLYHVYCSGPGSTEFANVYLVRTVPFFGPLAVCIFFVVSGFSLSIGYFNGGGNRLLMRLVAGRYFRLAIPVLGACVIVHVAMVVGLVPAPDQRLAPFGSIAGFTDPTIGYLLKFSLFDVFFKYIHHLSYIGPLWSMHVEMIGSMIVFTLLYCLRNARFRTIALIAVAAAVYMIAGHWYVLFVVGMLLAEFFARGRVIRPGLAIVLLLTGAGIPLFWNEDPSLVAASGALLTIGAVYWLPLRSFLSNKLSRWLGAISFPLYLLHGAVMMVLGAPLMMSFGGSPVANFAVQTLTVLLSFGAAVLFWPVDALSIQVSRRVGELAADSALRHTRPADASRRRLS